MGEVEVFQRIDHANALMAIQFGGGGGTHGRILMHRENQTEVRLALNELAQRPQVRAHRFTKIFMAMGGKDYKAPACGPLLQQFHPFAGAFRRQSLTQRIHRSVAHHMDRIRRAPFAQKSTTIPRGDNKVAGCNPTNPQAAPFFRQWAQRVSYGLRGIQMSHRNAAIVSSQ